MTFQQIKDDLATAGKAVSDVQLYRYMRVCKIKPVAAKTIPRHYPNDATKIISDHLGLQPLVYQLVPLAELKRTAKKARAAR